MSALLHTHLRNRSRSPLERRSSNLLLNIRKYLEFLVNASPYPDIAYHEPTVRSLQSSSCKT